MRRFARIVLAAAGSVLAVAAGEPRPAPPAATSGVAVGAEQPRPGPHAVYENPEVDLGKIVRGTTAEAVFRIRNAGTEPVRIASARPG